MHGTHDYCVFDKFDRRKQRQDNAHVAGYRQTSEPSENIPNTVLDHIV